MIFENNEQVTLIIKISYCRLPTTTPMCEGQVVLGKLCKDMAAAVYNITAPKVEKLFYKYCWDSGLVPDIADVYD